MNGIRTTLASVAVTALLIGAAVGPAAATQTVSPSMTVDLAADGDADVTVVSTFDLASDDQQAAFDELRDNETARTAYLDRFEDRWDGVVTATEARTGREMSISDASLELSREGSTGVATFTVTWENLAAVEDGTLSLSEPFASEFTPDRQFTVVLPEGYELSSATPEPATESDGRLVYEAGATLDGFSVVAEETEQTGGSGPGFGVAGALIALLAAALIAHRRG